eukprot:100121-Chlamydomonas_euryale.AAC.5
MLSPFPQIISIPSLNPRLRLPSPMPAPSCRRSSTVRAPAAHSPASLCVLTRLACATWLEQRAQLGAGLQGRAAAQVTGAGSVRGGGCGVGRVGCKLGRRAQLGRALQGRVAAQVRGAGSVGWGD